MAKKIIKCSQCNKEFETGFDYRMHWETHLDDYLKKNKKKIPNRNNKSIISFFYFFLNLFDQSCEFCSLLIRFIISGFERIRCFSPFDVR